MLGNTNGGVSARKHKFLICLRNTNIRLCTIDGKRRSSCERALKVISMHFDLVVSRRSQLNGNHRGVQGIALAVHADAGGVYRQLVRLHAAVIRSLWKSHLHTGPRQPVSVSEFQLKRRPLF